MPNCNPWYTTAFNPRYPHLYSHRDNRETELLYDTLRARNLLFHDGFSLDAACGTGRWLRCLRTHNHRAVGFDLSSSQLSATHDLMTVRADLLHFPFRNETFQQVVSLFSSFGYFSDESFDQQQLNETSRVLVPGGTFLLDTMPYRALNEIVATSHFTFPDGVTAEIKRERIGDKIRKTILLSNGESWEEQLRLYPTAHIDEMAATCNLRLVDRFGSYAGDIFDENHANRVISCYVQNR
ncbi:MAG: class I SAM-dependent methyltransferase [bacterium]|nr:class I SAM-dependent methyltransferase [bacterium]